MSALIFWKGVSYLADLQLIVPLSIVLMLWLWHQKKYNGVLFLFVCFYGGAFLNSILKKIIQRPRPVDALIPVGGYSFPSGHVMSAILFYSLIIILFMHQIKNTKIRYGFLTVNIIIILMVGLSRIMLKVHYVSDVLGAFAIGLLWLWLLWGIFPRIGGEIEG